MRGLDTNILVRYFTQDDAIQSPRANRIVAGLTQASPGFISLIALAESIWVLERSYGLAAAELANILTKVLQTATFEVQNEREVYFAMTMLQKDEASFSDALIGALGAWAGCSETLTFDRKASRLPSFRLA